MTRSEFFKAIGLTALSLGVFKLVGDRKQQHEYSNQHGKTLWYSNDGITWEEQAPVNLSTQNMGKIPPYVTWEGKIYKLIRHRP
jgi:hypothetical protein